MPLVTLYQCDAITGDANKSANTYSKLQHVFNPANGLVREYQRLWNETKDLPLVDRMEYAMETSCTLKSIVRHHLYMKCGSGYDRTFPDVMMTFVFGWGKTNIQQAFRKDEMNGMDDEQLEFMQNHPTKAIFFGATTSMTTSTWYSFFISNFLDASVILRRCWMMRRKADSSHSSQ